MLHTIMNSQLFGVRFKSCLCKMAQRTCSLQSEVIFDEIKNKGVITLNRPKSLNAINESMIKEIYPKLKKWEHCKSLIIIKGSGNKAFSAGGDIVAIAEAGLSGDKLRHQFFPEEYTLNCLIATYHIPYIALINGITMGGGAGVSIHGSHRIATENTLFAMPETGIGFFPDVGGSYFLPRLGGEIGTFIGLTGYRLKGIDTIMAGIATHFCDSDFIPELEESLLNLESPYPENINKVIMEFSELSKHNKNKTFSLAPHLSTIAKCFKENSLEAILRNLEKDGSEFSKVQIKKLNKMSPTSLKVTLEELRKGETLSIQECLSMEYRISQRIFEGKDFYEGVRAVLIDKDNDPKWNPSKLEDVSQEVVDHHFSPLPKENELIL